MVTIYNRKRAFTLIELLVVVSIILIGTSLLFVGGGGGGDGVKLSSAQRIVSSIAQGARGQAILKGATTRLIIYSENNPAGDPEKWLRYFGVVYLQADDPTTAGIDESGWVATTQGTYLPVGIYFDPTTSATIGDSNWPEAAATMDIDYPRQSAQQEGSGDEYYFYEFNSNGTVSLDFINTWMVIRAGVLKPGSGDTLEVNFEDPTLVNLKAALIFRRVGSTTLVTNFGDNNEDVD